MLTTDAGLTGYPYVNKTLAKRDKKHFYILLRIGYFFLGEILRFYCENLVIQIGLLNFTLFPKLPEFFATYKFLNVKNHSLYSDKLQIRVLDLTHIDLATMEDKQYQLDHWASLFKAKTWEEVMMLAQKNQCIGEAAETIYQLSQEEKIRFQCEAREDYYRTQLGWQNMLKERDSVIQNQKNQLIEQQNNYEKLLTWAREHGYES